MLFRNRREAAMELIPLLEKHLNEQGVILAVPRGGVPLGYYIAKAYHLPLELLISKKIGHPLNPEVAIGAVSLEDHIVDERHNIPASYIEKEIIRIRESLKENYKKFMGNRTPVSLKNKTVIIIDDGIATGNTILGSIKMLRKQQPKKIVVAVPVAPAETAAKIRKQVDDFICLHIPEHFVGVGIYYEDFSEVSDEKVTQFLNEANRTENAH